MLRALRWVWRTGYFGPEGSSTRLIPRNCVGLAHHIGRNILGGAVAQVISNKWRCCELALSETRPRTRKDEMPNKQ